MSDAEQKAAEIAARMTEQYRQIGDSMWETPAGAAAIRLLGRQETVTIPDIIAELERDVGTDRRLTAMNESVIAKLRDLEAHRQSG